MTEVGSDETVPPGTKEQGDAVVEHDGASPAAPDEGLIRYRPPLRRWVRSQLLVGGFVLGGLGVLFALPDSVTGWEGDYLAKARQQFCRTWTEPPVLDKDDWHLNYVAHPYCGSLAYNLMRSQGSGVFESFVFSTIQSCLWEYVWEGFAEQPSIQDLIATPIVGSLLGELIHYGTLKMKRKGFSLLDKILVTIINPCFVVNNGYK